MNYAITDHIVRNFWKLQVLCGLRNNIIEVHVLAREDCWFERGVKERFCVKLKKTFK